ncbi:META domain-containing protein [Mycolicibacterium sp.]|jgi:heat shock protein HslJ|uniref:META domain-containing protein n=1 Tax=Mycolicibacterium sp. TaxID=2320850 RepID=UPI0028ABBE69|nr:META domain-containing protein [Mycolicibacterium sp.]
MRIASVIGVTLGLHLVLAAAGCGTTPEVADPLTGTTWQLIKIESMAPDEQPSTEIEQRSEYTVTFGDDGKAGFRVDCNRGNSTWKRDGEGSSGGLTFGPIAVTKMMCPKPSNDTEVAAALARVRSYLVKDGKLHLSLEADSGIMHFEPLPTGQ